MPNYRLAILSTGLIFGIGICSSVATCKENKKEFSPLKIDEELNFENRWAFDDSGIFKEMEEIQKKMKIIFDNHQKQLQILQKELDKTSNKATKSKIAFSEVDDGYIYELTFSGFQKEEVVINVENNNLLIFANNQKNVGLELENKKETVNSFYYSFSLPDFDRNKQPEIMKLENKIIIKLIKNPKNLDKDKKPIESEKNIKEKVVKKEKKKSDNVFVETSAESNKSASKSDKKDVQYSDNSSLQTIDWPF
jgi:HSP20 family molecular chaperone IbpA